MKIFKLTIYSIVALFCLGLLTMLSEMLGWGITNTWPHLKWWQYLLAPLVLGVSLLLGEGGLLVIDRWMNRDELNQPRWKRSLARVLQLSYLVGLLALLAWLWTFLRL